MANQVLEIRQNIFYTKETSAGEFKKMHEIIFIVDESKYSRTNESEVIRERGCKEVRITVGAKSLEKVIEVLSKFKDTKEEEMS